MSLPDTPDMSLSYIEGLFLFRMSAKPTAKPRNPCDQFDEPRGKERKKKIGRERERETERDTRFLDSWAPRLLGSEAPRLRRGS